LQKKIWLLKKIWLPVLALTAAAGTLAGAALAQGMNIAICCTAGSDDESREMLRMFGLPFKNEDEAAA